MLGKLSLKIKLLLVASLLALTTWAVFEYQQWDWAYVGEMDIGRSYYSKESVEYSDALAVVKTVINLNHLITEDGHDFEHASDIAVFIIDCKRRNFILAGGYSTTKKFGEGASIKESIHKTDSQFITDMKPIDTGHLMHTLANKICKPESENSKGVHFAYTGLRGLILGKLIFLA
jgi:hypothetical protein